jgi:hypothetical protein
MVIQPTVCSGAKSGTRSGPKKYRGYSNILLESSQIYSQTGEDHNLNNYTPVYTVKLAKTLKNVVLFTFKRCFAYFSKNIVYFLSGLLTCGHSEND